MAKTHVTATINGDEVECLCEPEETLLDILRDTKPGLPEYFGASPAPASPRRRRRAAPSWDFPRSSMNTDGSWHCGSAAT